MIGNNDLSFMGYLKFQGGTTNSQSTTRITYNLQKPKNKKQTKKRKELEMTLKKYHIMKQTCTTRKTPILYHLNATINLGKKRIQNSLKASYYQSLFSLPIDVVLLVMRFVSQTKILRFWKLSCNVN